MFDKHYINLNDLTEIDMACTVVASCIKCPRWLVDNLCVSKTIVENTL